MVGLWAFWVLVELGRASLVSSERLDVVGLADGVQEYTTEVIGLSSGKIDEGEDTIIHYQGGSPMDGVTFVEDLWNRYDPRSCWRESTAVTVMDVECFPA